METIHHDYASKGVKFYYVYKALAHPEHNGYVAPYTLKERLMHIKEAQRTLGTKIPWIADTIENDLKHALGDAPNSEFLLDPQGRLIGKRAWSRPSELRSDLEKLVGPVKNPTTVADLNRTIPPPLKRAASGVVGRISLPSGGLQAVKIEPIIEEKGKPFYVKLRAEAERGLLQNGNGKLYLGFFLDPLYSVHWNNLSEPLHFNVEPTKGMAVSPTTGDGPKVKVAADIDPREFLLEISGAKQDAPLELTVTYFACDDAETFCTRITQKYRIILEADRDGGRRMSAGRGGRRGRGGFAARLLQSDKNGDGKISRAEAPERMREFFNRIDSNNDGFLDKKEIEARSRRSRGRRGRGIR